MNDAWTTASAGMSLGHQTDLVTYGSYLRVPQLLDQQRLQSAPAAHDEMLFIVIHQVYELWFKLMLVELTDARDRMLRGEAHPSLVRLERCHAIERVLLAQVDVIDTMTPQDFLEFRDRLAPASGFQSVQFREIEFVSGLKDAAFVDRLRGLTAEEEARLRRRLAEKSLWDSYVALLEQAGFDVRTPESRLVALTEIARDRASHQRLWDLAEALIDHDQAWALWRARHVLMAERQIGAKPGTGGSSGGMYLRSRVELRFYPELWELRTRL